MKKLYAILAAALAVSLSVSAAPGITMGKTLKVEEQNFNKTATFVGTTNRSIEFNKMSAKKAPARLAVDPYADPFAGDWLLTYTNSNMGPDITSFTILPSAVEGEYYISGLLFGADANDIPCTIEYDEDYEVYMLTIAGSGANTLISAGGNDYGLYLFGYDDEGNAGLYVNDIEFIVLPEEGYMVFGYMNSGFAWYKLGVGGNWLTEPTGYKANAHMTFSEVGYDDDDLPVILSTDTVPMVVECYEDDGDSIFVGFGGYSEFQMALLDKEAGKVNFEVGTPLFIYSGYDETEEDYYQIPFALYPYDVNEIDLVDELTADVKINADGTSTLTFNQGWLLFNPEGYGAYAFYTDTTIECDFPFWTVEAPEANVSLEAMSAEATVGDKVWMGVEMNNNVAISAFQCDVKVPAGLEFVNWYRGERASEEGRVAAYNEIAAGVYRLICYSNTSAAIEGEEGLLFSVQFDAAKAGEYTVTVENIVLTSPDGTQYKPAATTATIKVVKEAQLGDVNGDGEVTIGDVTALVQYILGETPDKFNAAMADLNGDGDINVTDVVLAVNEVLAQAATRAPQQGAAKVAGKNSIFVDNFQIRAGETKTIQIKMNNDFEATALQFNMILPEGLSVVESAGDYQFDLSDRATASHMAASAYQNGIYSALCYSSNNSSLINGENGVMEVTVVASEDFDKGEIMIYNAIVVDNNGAEHFLAASMTQVCETTGISAVEAAQADATYFNLQGQRVNNAKGFLIEVRNGEARKVIVK